MYAKHRVVGESKHDEGKLLGLVSSSRPSKVDSETRKFWKNFDWTAGPSHSKRIKLEYSKLIVGKMSVDLDQPKSSLGLN